MMLDLRTPADRQKANRVRNARTFVPRVVATAFGCDTLRKRRLRQRARRGLGILVLEIDVNRLIAAMLEAGRLTEAQALDRKLVAVDAAQILARWAEEWLK